MKKLLITMGDSWTFGHGAYLPELETKFINGKITKDYLFYSSVDNFLDNSWPTHFARHFNFELINLAMPGGSNSGQVKRLVGPYTKQNNNFFLNYAVKRKDQTDPKLIDIEISDIDFKKFDKVTLIWLLSYPHRFSFFKSGEVKDIIPGIGKEEAEKEFGESYVKYIDTDFDYMLETIFYLNVVDMFCKINDINFLYAVLHDDVVNQFPLFCKKQNCLNILNNNMIIDYKSKIKEYSFCGHPNHIGYKIMANEIINIVQNNHQQLI